MHGVLAKREVLRTAAEQERWLLHTHAHKRLESGMEEGKHGIGDRKYFEFAEVFRPHWLVRQV